MFKNFILFSHGLGQGIKGVEKTPFYISSLLKSEIPIINSEVSNDCYQNLYNLYQTNYLINGSRVNIGGDHSMSIATLSDSLIRYPNLKVIWMDAHPDINTFSMSKSKNLHGMPLSIVTGIEKKSDFRLIDKYINPSQIMYVGIRDIDPFEQDVISSYKMRVISTPYLNTNYNLAWKEISDFIGDNPVHLSFDMDVLDPLVMPSTGTPVPHGLQLNPCKQLIDKIMTKNIVSLDLAELNLDIGTIVDRTRSLIHLSYLFKNYIF